MGWARLSTMANLAGELKGEQSAHTVAKTGKGRVEQVTNAFGRGQSQRLKIIWHRLTQAPIAARELNRPDLNIDWEKIRPGAEYGDSAAGVREAEQPQPRARVRFSTMEPGISLHNT